MTYKTNVSCKFPSKSLFSNAFTMIELIFAIVIIGITMLSVPLLIVTDSETQQRNLVQEGIMITTTKVSQILTYPWDPQSSPAGGVISASQVVTTPAAPVGLDRVAGLDFRPGHFQLALRRHMTPVNAERNATVIGAVVPGATTNLNDFDGTIVNLVGGAGALAYKNPYRLTTTVTYVSDALTANNYNTAGITDLNFDYNLATAANTTNIKLIRVLADQQDPTTLVWTPVVQLSSYSCNIGETSLYKRRY